MLVEDTRTPPHRKSTLQGRLEPITCPHQATGTAEISLTPSISFNFQETLTSQPQMDRTDIPPPMSHRELKPVRAPHGSLPTTSNDDILSGRVRSSQKLMVNQGEKLT